MLCQCLNQAQSLISQVFPLYGVLWGSLRGPKGVGRVRTTSGSPQRGDEILSEEIWSLDHENSPLDSETRLLGFCQSSEYFFGSLKAP